MARFKDRTEAGKELAVHIGQSLPVLLDAVVVGISPGGICTAAPIASSLSLPLETIPIVRIAHPDRPNDTIGVIGPDGELILKQQISDEELELLGEQIERARTTAAQLQQKVPSASTAELRYRTVIAVDDGVLTGQTMALALERIRDSRPEKLVVASPVIAQASFEILKSICHTIIALEAASERVQLDQWYDDFSPIDTKTARRLIRECNRRLMESSS